MKPPGTRTRATLGFGALALSILLAPLLSLAAGPYLLLSSHDLVPGSTLSMQGNQFEPSTNVLVSLAGASATAAVTNGSFNAKLTVPDVPTGTYTVLATSPQRVQASASVQIRRPQFYPNAEPSLWYLLPGQQLSFRGSGFAPNTLITIQGGGGTIEARTDGGGSFSTSPITVPFRWQNSMQTFDITSPRAAYTIHLHVAIGTFYPQLSPSAYYIGVNQPMSASVGGFAPGEPVMLLVNGSLVRQTNADGGGNASFSFTTPSTGSSFTLLAQGANSGVVVSRVITLHP